MKRRDFLKIPLAVSAVSVVGYKAQAATQKEPPISLEDIKRAISTLEKNKVQGPYQYWCHQDIGKDVFEGDFGYLTVSNRKIDFYK